MAHVCIFGLTSRRSESHHHKQPTEREDRKFFKIPGVHHSQARVLSQMPINSPLSYEIVIMTCKILTPIGLVLIKDILPNYLFPQTLNSHLDGVSTVNFEQFFFLLKFVLRWLYSLVVVRNTGEKSLVHLAQISLVLLVPGCVLVYSSSIEGFTYHNKVLDSSDAARIPPVALLHLHLPSSHPSA